MLVPWAQTLGLASGAWAVLFTDVSGSTALRVRLGDDQADMVYGEHDGLVRATIDAAGGLVVKTTGDGLMAAFRSSAEAIAAAVRIQQAVVAADQRQEVGLKVRVGISMGDVALQGGDLQGIPVVDWAERAIAATGGVPSASHAEALVHRAIAVAVDALERRDESLARQAAELTETGAIMSEPFPAPRRMFCRLLAGNAHSALALAWPHYAETAQRHYAAGIDIEPPAAPYLGLHAELCARLAVLRFVAGDISAAGALARQAQRITASSGYLVMDSPLIVAAIVAVATTAGVDALHAELRAYHDTARRGDWGPRAIATIVLYGGILATVREDWELAAKLLAAVEATDYAHRGGTALAVWSFVGVIAHLYLYFRDRVDSKLGPDLARTLRDEGRAMPLADALAAALS